MTKRSAHSDPGISNPYATARSTIYYTDFVLWRENKMLNITPKFQRRKVWRTPAKALLIDTMLRGMTIPALYVRLNQDVDTKKMVREVVDGQQRVHSILEFVDDEYRLSANDDVPWGGKKFSQLTDRERERLAGFGLTVETFSGISDRQIFQVFSRLNMNGVQLNKQELRNGTYFGLFKNASYELAYDYLAFWRKNKIFSEMSLARMLEVELTSELLVAANDGMQDKKSSLDDFYGDHEDSYSTRSRDQKRFRATMATISESFSDSNLAETAFHRPPLFYTLFCVVYHRLFGLPAVPRSTPKKALTADGRQSLRNAVIKLSDVIALSRDAAADVPSKYTAFVTACQRQTDNILPRRERFNTLYGEAF